MERVGVVRRCDHETGVTETTTQNALPVDADMATRDRMVRLRKPPVHTFGEVTRDGHHQRAPGAQDANNVTQDRRVVGNVFENLGTDDVIERSIGKRYMVCVTHHRGGQCPRGVKFSLQRHSGQHPLYTDNFVTTSIESDDMRTFTGEGEGVSTKSTAEVEYVSIAQSRQSIKAHRKH